MRQIYKLTAPQGALSIASSGADNVTYTQVNLAASGDPGGGDTVSTTIPDTTTTIVMQTETASRATEAYIEYDGGETLIDRWGGSIIGPGRVRVFPMSSVTSDGTYPKLKLLNADANTNTVHLWFYA
jgi:hypothetical protein